MVNGALNLFSTSDDFGFEELDSRFEFGHRKGVEVLPGQLACEIVGSTGKIFVGVHATKR